MDEERLEQLAKQAKMAAVITGLAAAVAIVILIIDNTIKAAILREAAKATDLLREAQRTVAGGGNYERATQAGEGGTVPGPGLNGDHGVDDATAAGAAVDPPGDAGKAAAAVGKNGVARGAPRHG